MSLEIETNEAISALKAAAKECGDVVALAARPDELPDSFEGRGYAFIVQRIQDLHLVINNGLKDIGESPVVPAAPAPRVEVQTETVVETRTETVAVDKQSTLDELDQLRATIAKKDELLDQATQEIELVLAENQKLKAESKGAPEAAIEHMEAVKETLEARETPFSFGSDFINSEKLGDETPPATNKRLLAEFEELQQTRASLDEEADKRREHLRTAFFRFRG